MRNLSKNNQKLDNILAHYYLEAEEGIKKEVKELKWELELELKLELELELEPGLELVLELYFNQ